MTPTGATPQRREELVSLSGGGSSLVLRLPVSGLPEVVHWGADLGPSPGSAQEELVRAGDPAVPSSAMDEPWPLTLLPTEADGWSGRPGFSAHREGVSVIPDFADGARLTRADPDAGRIVLEAMARVVGWAGQRPRHPAGRHPRSVRAAIPPRGPVA